MILLTAFEPFGGLRQNPSEQLLRALETGSGIQAEVLPTTFAGAASGIKGLLNDLKPNVLLMLGVAETCVELSLEQTAYNWDEARIADNAGFQPCGCTIIEGGPETYASSLPCEKIRQALEQHQIPVAFSWDPGRFVCNHVFYQACHHIESSVLPTRAGFVHIPLFDTIPLKRQLQALQIMCDVCQS